MSKSAKKHFLLVPNKHPSMVGYVFACMPLTDAFDMYCGSTTVNSRAPGQVGPYWPLKSGWYVLKDGAPVELQYTDGDFRLISIDVKDVLLPDYRNNGFQGDLQYWVYHTTVEADSALNRIQAYLRRQRFHELSGEPK